MAYVYRNGSRLTPWMAHCVDQLAAAFKKRWGLDLIVSSGIRTHQEQIDIFLDRYRIQAVGRGPFNDVRWWKGKRYVRVSGAGTVAQPGTSNHEIQGSAAAVDFRDSGKDKGVLTIGTARSNWLKANAPRFGLEPEGFKFGESWHYRIPGIYREVPKPAGGSSKPVTPRPPVVPAVPEEEDEDMKPTVHVRTEKGIEYTLAHPEFGKDLAQHTGPGTGGKRTAGKVTTYRGFMTTADKATGIAWARMYAGGAGNETSRTNRADYIAIQVEASRVAAEFFPAK